MKSVTFGQLWAVIGLGLMCITNQTYAKEYYKWVDARGVTTYSATPPPSQKKEPQLDPLKKIQMLFQRSKQQRCPIVQQ